MLYLAEVLARKRRQVRELWGGLAGPLIVVAITAVLVGLEPDLSGAVSVVLVALLLFWLGGARLGHILLVGATAATAALTVVVGAGYGINRVVGGFLDRSVYAQEQGYHVSQSLLGLGSGGLWAWV